MKLIGPRMGRQFFKNVDFSVTYPLKFPYRPLLEVKILKNLHSCQSIFKRKMISNSINGH